MLDDLKFIHQRDGQDALGIAEKQWQQLEHEFELPDLRSQISDLRFSNIVYAGMGGSALAALLSKTWPGYPLPFEVIRQYHIPKYVSPNTLFIVSSYSGNTEEELTTIAEAEKTGATIVVMASGGRLYDIARRKGFPLMEIPDVHQPRFAVFSDFKALCTILMAAGLLDEAETQAELAKAAEFLKDAVKQWLPTVPMDKNPAKKLAFELAGNSIAIYGGPLMAPAAYKFKIDINENAKNVAWWNELPEFDHNELIGWSSHPIEKPYAIVNLISKLEHPRVKKRFEVAEKLLSGRRPMANNVEVQGDSLLSQLLWAVNFADFTSIYLALLNNQNPTPVDLVEKFKTELG